MSHHALTDESSPVAAICPLCGQAIVDGDIPSAPDIVARETVGAVAGILVDAGANKINGEEQRQ